MTFTLAAADALLGDPLYPRLKAHVVGSTGLTYYYDDKDAYLSQRIGQRLSYLGVRDCSAYLDILRDPLRGPVELDALVAEITIGETYFFRHQEHFDAIRDLIIPNLIERNRAGRCLRIWCAGCADGPEAYSLAILLKREMAGQLQGWQVTILGTDINRRSLARAREGRFEEWALRATSEHLKHTCFVKNGKLWSVLPEYREGVSFRYHNLADNPSPSLLNDLSAFDLIVCRNVMIYFGPDLMLRTIRQFSDCLAPEAWLLVGPSEPNMTCFTSFRTVNASGVTLYQKADRHASGPEENLPAVLAPPPPVLRPFCSRPPVLRLQAADKPPALLREAAKEPPASRIDPTLADVRRHADRGDWEDAARCCEELLKKDALKSAVHFHHALVLEQIQRHADAERSLRRAIYLDRQSVLPHYYLGLLLQSRGDPRQAVRSFENALELLRSRRANDTFAEADDITAAELTKLAKMHIEILRGRV